MSESKSPGRKLFLWLRELSAQEGEYWLVRATTDINEWSGKTMTSYDRIEEGVFHTDEQLRTLRESDIRRAVEMARERTYYAQLGELDTSEPKYTTEQILEKLLGE